MDKKIKSILVAWVGRWEIFKKFWKSRIPIPFRQRVNMIFHGFLPESWVIYQIENNNLKNFVNDYSRFVKNVIINIGYSQIFNDKLLTYSLLHNHVSMPKIYGAIDRGQVIYKGETYAINLHEMVLDTCRQHQRLVLKPVEGKSGEGVLLLQWEANQSQWILNRKSIEEDTLLKNLRSLKHYLVCQFVYQAPYVSMLYPETTNTLRILTMVDSDTKEPFIARAIQRIGVRNSYPVDNWSRGGLSANINIKTGKMGKGVTYPYNGELIWHRCHPETKVPIEGEVIPNWQNITDTILKICKELAFIKYIGWDVVPTSEGFSVIEVNANSDLNLLQVHGGLLEDKRIERFFYTNWRMG